MNDSIGVLVVDDQPLIADGLARILNARPETHTVGVVTESSQVADAVQRFGPDLVLLDLRMPRPHGLDVLTMLGHEHPEVPVVVLTTVRQEKAVLEALRLGASAYLTKDAPPDLLLDCIRRAHTGDRTIGAPELEHLLSRQIDGISSTPDQQVLPELSAREREVFLLCARGLSNREIAETAYRSEATVKTHIAAILRKLGLRSRVQLAIHAYEQGILRPSQPNRQGI